MNMYIQPVHQQQQQRQEQEQKDSKEKKKRVTQSCNVRVRRHSAVDVLPGLADPDTSFELRSTFEPHRLCYSPVPVYPRSVARRG